MAEQSARPSAMVDVKPAHNGETRPSMAIEEGNTVGSRPADGGVDPVETDPHVTVG